MSDKMSCNVIRDILPSYVDDICSEESRGYVEEHIKTCPECMEMLKAMKEDMVTIGSGDDISIDEKKVLKEVGDKVKRDLRKQSLMYKIICAVLVAIILVLALPVRPVPSEAISFNMTSVQVKDAMSAEAYTFLDASEDTIYLMDNDTDVDKAQFHQIIVSDRAGGRLFVEEKWAEENETITLVEINSKYMLKDYKYHIEEVNGVNMFVLDKASTNMLAGTGEGSYVSTVIVSCQVGEARVK